MFLVNLFKGSIYHNGRQHKVYLHPDRKTNYRIQSNCPGGEKEMDSFTSQVIAVVVFGVLITVLPGIINKWSDSRSQVR